MAARGFHRGHEIVFVGDGWAYRDTMQPVDTDPDRPCGWCRRDNRYDGHDRCLGALTGVVNACCGHGRGREAYLMLTTGARVSGDDALRMMRRLGGEPPMEV